MTYCTIALRSITYAMKGQQLLSMNAISSKIVKLQAAQTEKGCAYGLEFDCWQGNNVAILFQKNGIPYSELGR